MAALNLLAVAATIRRNEMSRSTWTRRAAACAFTALFVGATTGDAARGAVRAGGPHWIASGRMIAFQTFVGNNYLDRHLWFMNADGSRKRQISAWPASLSGAVASPSGRLIADIRDTGDEAVVLIGRVGGPTRRFTIRVPDLEGYDAVVWAPNEGAVAVAVCCGAGRRFDMIFVVDLRRGVRLVSRDRLSNDESPAWSPDSQRIAFVTCPQRGGTCGLATMRPDGSARKAIVRNVRDLDSDSSPEPAWAPSGREIAYVRTVGVERERRSAHFFRHAIYVVRRDGSDLRRVTTTPFINNVFGEIPVAWSPESRSLAFIDPRGVATVRVGVNRVRRLTRSRKFGLAQAGISWAP